MLEIVYFLNNIEECCTIYSLLNAFCLSINNTTQAPFLIWFANKGIINEFDINNKYTHEYQF